MSSICIKKTLLLLIILSALSGCRLLRIGGDPLKPGKHFKSTEFQRFVGTWQGYYHKDTFTIDLKIDTLKLEKEQISMEVLIGNYTFQRFQDSLKQVGEIKGIATTPPGFKKRTRAINFHNFFDYVKGKSGLASMELLPKADTVAQWILKENRHLVVGDDGWTPGFSIPTNMILRKVK